MIIENDKKIILELAKKYNVSAIFLFGSSIERSNKYNDIDIGVKGIEPRFFLKNFIRSYLETCQNRLI